MQITLYHRTYPVEGAPESVSLAPFPAYQRHTFAAGGTVYEAVYKEVQVFIPDDATVGSERLRLQWGASSEPVVSWAGEKGPVVSTAKEVLVMAHARHSGFRLAR